VGDGETFANGSFPLSMSTACLVNGNECLDIKTRYFDIENLCLRIKKLRLGIQNRCLEIEKNYFDIENVSFEECSRVNVEADVFIVEVDFCEAGATFLDLEAGFVACEALGHDCEALVVIPGERPVVWEAALGSRRAQRAESTACCKVAAAAAPAMHRHSCLCMRNRVEQLLR
jgi:hypothetical protein